MTDTNNQSMENLYDNIDSFDILNMFSKDESEAEIQKESSANVKMIDSSNKTNLVSSEVNSIKKPILTINLPNSNKKQAKPTQKITIKTPAKQTNRISTSNIKFDNKKPKDTPAARSIQQSSNFKKDSKPFNEKKPDFDTATIAQQKYDMEKLNEEYDNIEEQDIADDLIAVGMENVMDDDIENDVVDNDQFNNLGNESRLETIGDMQEDLRSVSSDRITVGRENTLQFGDRNSFTIERTVRAESIPKLSYIESNNDMTGLSIEFLDVLNTLILLRDKQRIEDYTPAELNVLLSQDPIIGRLNSRQGNAGSTLLYVDVVYIGDLLNVLTETVKYYPRPMMTGDKKVYTAKGSSDEKFFVEQMNLYVKFKNGVEWIVSGAGANSNKVLNAQTSAKAANTDATKRAAIHLGNLFGWSLYRSTFNAKALASGFYMSAMDVRITSFDVLRHLILTNMIVLLCGNGSEIKRMIPEVNNIKGGGSLYLKIFRGTSINKKIQYIIDVLNLRKGVYSLEMEEEEKNMFIRIIQDKFNIQVDSGDTKTKEIN